jgi:hypothetical protein
MARSLCEGTDDWEGTVDCFVDQTSRHGDADLAVAFCRMENGVGEQPAGEVRPLHIVNHTDVPQYVIVLGKDTAKDSRYVGLAQTASLVARGEKTILVELNRSWSHVYFSVYVSTDPLKVTMLDNEVDKANITLVMLNALLEGNDLSTRNVPKMLPLQGTAVTFDDAVGVELRASTARPTYLALTGTNKATIVKKGNLYRARSPASLPDRAKTQLSLDESCAKEPVHALRRQTFASWYDASEARAEDKGCTWEQNGERKVHVPCRSLLMSPPKAARFDLSVYQPGDNRQPGCRAPRGNRFWGRPLARTAQSLDDRFWADIRIKDQQCTASWATSLSRAHNKGCRNGRQTYHVRCELPDGSYSTLCENLPRGSFNNLPMLDVPTRLSDRAWTEVAVSCPQAAWADKTMHNKGCPNAGMQVYHVRCENPDGSWSTQCTDIVPGTTSMNGRLVLQAKRLPDRAWSEIWQPGCI